MLGYSKDDIAFLSFIHAVGADIEEVTAKAVRLDRPLAHEKEREVNIVEVDEGFELRDVDILSRAGHGTMKQRRADCQRAMDTSIGVAEVVAHILGWAVRLTRHRHHPALGLSDDVKTRVMSVGPILAITRNRTHNKTRVDLFQ